MYHLSDERWTIACPMIRVDLYSYVNLERLHTPGIALGQY